MSNGVIEFLPYPSGVNPNASNSTTITGTNLPEGMPEALIQSMLHQGGTGMSHQMANEIAGMTGHPEQIIQNFNALNTIAQTSTFTASTAIDYRIVFTTIIPPLTSPAHVNSLAPSSSTSSTTSTTTGSHPAEARHHSSRIHNQEVAEEEKSMPGEDLEAAAYGMAAGDSPYDRFGVWGSINTGIAHQKMRKGNPGFKSLSQGAIIGLDTMINDLTSIGFAASYSMNHIKHKDASIGNKTDASSWVGAVYGNRQLEKNWFIRGTVLFNRTHLNDKTFINIPTGKGLVQSKYNLISYGAEANVGYAHRFVNLLTATPTIGLRIVHSNKSSYSQFGNTSQNTQNLTQKAMNNYSALAGLSVSRTLTTHGINLTPEAHANFQYGINMKGPRGSFVSPLTPTEATTFVGTKSAALTSTYGVSLTGGSDRIECRVSADMSLADKYVGYQGALKLKVKF